MDYRNFSAIYDALSSALADFETLSGAKIETIGKIEKAQVHVLKQFDQFFPSRIEDVLNRIFFSTESFFGIIAKYPDLLKQKEEKFISFCCSLFIYMEEHSFEENFQLTENFFKVMNSSAINEYRPISGEYDKICFFAGFSFGRAARLGGKEAQKHIDTFETRRGWIGSK